MGGRAVVALEPDDGGAREILLEAQDVVDLGAAPAIDRLVVVADAADVDLCVSLTGRALPLARRWPSAGAAAHLARTPGRACGLRPRPCAAGSHLPTGGGWTPSPLGPASGRCASSRSHMYCAVLVSWYSSTRMYLNLRWYSLSTSGCCAEDADRVHQEVAEIAGVERRQPILIGRDRAARPLPLAKERASPSGISAGPRPLFFQPSIIWANVRGGQRLSSSPSAWMIWLEQPDLVVGVEDGEAGFQPGQLGVAAQQLDADRMEGAEPRHALDRFADQQADALLHLARRLVGEGDGEDLRGKGEAERQDVGDAGGQHARLAGAGAGQHEHGALGGLDGQPLLGVQPFEIARLAIVAVARSHGARGNAARPGGPGPPRAVRRRRACRRESRTSHRM